MRGTYRYRTQHGKNAKLVVQALQTLQSWGQHYMLDADGGGPAAAADLLIAITPVPSAINVTQPAMSHQKSLLASLLLRAPPFAPPSGILNCGPACSVKLTQSTLQTSPSTGVCECGVVAGT